MATKVELLKEISEFLRTYADIFNLAGGNLRLEQRMHWYEGLEKADYQTVRRAHKLIFTRVLKEAAICKLTWDEMLKGMDADSWKRLMAITRTQETRELQQDLAMLRAAWSVKPPSKRLHQS